VGRGEASLAHRSAVVFATTLAWTGWVWEEVPPGVLRAGRVRVEISNVDGCLDLDTLSLRPTPP
jgi:hypothetical protein